MWAFLYCFIMKNKIISEESLPPVGIEPATPQHYDSCDTFSYLPNWANLAIASWKAKRPFPNQSHGANTIYFCVILTTWYYTVDTEWYIGFWNIFPNFAVHENKCQLESLIIIYQNSNAIVSIISHGNSKTGNFFYYSKRITTPSVKRQAAASKFWRLGWCLGMGLGPILEHHNAFKWDLAAWHAAWRSKQVEITFFTKILSMNSVKTFRENYLSLRELIQMRLMTISASTYINKMRNNQYPS